MPARLDFHCLHEQLSSVLWTWSKSSIWEAKSESSLYLMRFREDRIVFEDDLFLIRLVLMVEQRTVFDLITPDQFSILTYVISCHSLKLHWGKTAFRWTSPKCGIAEEVFQLLLVFHLPESCLFLLFLPFLLVAQILGLLQSIFLLSFSFIFLVFKLLALFLLLKSFFLLGVLSFDALFLFYLFFLPPLKLSPTFLFLSLLLALSLLF